MARSALAAPALPPPPGEQWGGQGTAVQHNNPPTHTAGLQPEPLSWPGAEQMSECGVLTNTLAWTFEFQVKLVSI